MVSRIEGSKIAGTFLELYLVCHISIGELKLIVFFKALRSLAITG